LPKQNPSPQGEKYGYFPSENPKNFVFRRAINDRPYIPRPKKEYFDSLRATTGRPYDLFFHRACVKQWNLKTVCGKIYGSTPLLS
jgi:hypothetical protein